MWGLWWEKEHTLKFQVLMTNEVQRVGALTERALQYISSSGGSYLVSIKTFPCFIKIISECCVLRKKKTLRKVIFQWSSHAALFLMSFFFWWLQGHLLWTLLGLSTAPYSVAGGIQMLQMLAGSLGLHRCQCHGICSVAAEAHVGSGWAYGRQRCLCQICRVLCYVPVVNPWNPSADNPPY